MKYRIQKYRKRIKKADGYFWNTIAGLVNAGEAVVLSMVVTRTSGLAEAGILSTAFAVANLMMTIGKFGVRSYQATDVEGRFTFSDYFWARIITVCLMLAVSFIYLFYSVQVRGEDNRKAAVILAVCLIYAVESVEDVFWGLYQLRQALDVGAKIFIVRWMSVLAVSISLLLTGYSLLEALFMGVFVCAVSFAVCNTAVFTGFCEKVSRPYIISIKQVLVQCAPLFAVSFLSFYVTNAPKYAVDKYLPQEACACYGFISMPVFVIGLLNGFLYQPSLVQMALEWKERRVQAFCKRVRGQCVILAGLTLLCVAGAGLCGIPVLSAIYGTDLDTYKAELLLLVLGGGMLAYAGYFCVLLTIMRRQRLIVYGYTGVAVLEAACIDAVAKNFEMMGVVVINVLLMGMLAGFFGFFVYPNPDKLQM